MCRKTRYDNEEQAQARAININFDNRINGDATRLRAYLCCHCGFYHLTSMSKGQHKKHRKRLRNAK